MLTEAEERFESYCKTVGAMFRRIPVASIKRQQRPDYTVRFGTYGVIVEVKEISPNALDRARSEELRNRRFAVWGQTPGERLRRQIRDANRQLSKFSERRAPTITTIFDATFSVSYTDPYNVKVAMFGLDALVFAVPQDMNVRPYLTGHKSGGKAVLTAGHNTSTSAVAILRVWPDRSQNLLVYHNHFARVPLDPDAIRPYVYEQYGYQRTPDKMPDWRAI